MPITFALPRGIKRSDSPGLHSMAVDMGAQIGDDSIPLDDFRQTYVVCANGDRIVVSSIVRVGKWPVNETMVFRAPKGAHRPKDWDADGYYAGRFKDHKTIVDKLLV